MFKSKKNAKPSSTHMDDSREAQAYASKTTSKRTWVVTIAVALIATYFLLKPYITVILFATLAAVLFNGVYHGLLKRFKGSRAKAATLVTFYSVLVFGIPVIVILALALDQAASFISSLELGNLSVGDFDIEQATQDIVSGINSTADNLIGNANLINSDQVNSFIETAIPEVLNTFVNLIRSVIASIPGFFMSLIIYFFVFTGLLVNQENIAKRLRYISPFSKKLNDLYVTRATAMAKAMLKGQLLIAFLQGFAGALSLAIIGFGEYFVFFLLIFTLLNMVPLGSGLILIPLGILMIPFGYVWQGLFILGVHFIVTTNIDNIVRPMVVPKEAWLPSSLIIISALGGVFLFGLPGVIYGPIIMSLVMTTFEAYSDENKERLLNKS